MMKKNATRRRARPEVVREVNRRLDFVSDVTPAATKTCEEVRAAHKKLALLVARATPPGRDQAMALTKIEESLHYAIAAIVRPRYMGD